MSSRTIPNEILFASAGALLREGKDVTIKVKGSSMTPFLRDGRDSVVLRRSDDFGIGDIVLVQFGTERFVMHRIVSVEGEVFTMMGDGNVRGCERFRRKDVLGKVIRVIRADGQEKKPGKARVWRALKPARRYLLAIYRRVEKVLG